MSSALLHSLIKEISGLDMALSDPPSLGGGDQLHTIDDAYSTPEEQQVYPYTPPYPTSSLSSPSSPSVYSSRLLLFSSYGGGHADDADSGLDPGFVYNVHIIMLVLSILSLLGSSYIVASYLKVC